MSHTKDENKMIGKYTYNGLTFTANDSENMAYAKTFKIREYEGLSRTQIDKEIKDRRHNIGILIAWIEFHEKNTCKHLQRVGCAFPDSAEDCKTQKQYVTYWNTHTKAISRLMGLNGEQYVEPISEIVEEPTAADEETFEGVPSRGMKREDLEFEITRLGGDSFGTDKNGEKKALPLKILKKTLTALRKLN